MAHPGREALSMWACRREMGWWALVLIALLLHAAHIQTSLPSTHSTQPKVGTSWVQVYAAPSRPERGPEDRDIAGITGILVSAGFLPVCSAGSNGEKMAVTSNNIRIAGSHWGAPFLRLRGGVQGVDDTWRKREEGPTKTKRQARIERGKKLKAVMGGKERMGRGCQKVPVQNQVFKSEWHKKRALQQAERRHARKMARKEVRFANASLPLPGHNASSNRLANTVAPGSAAAKEGRGNDGDEGEMESVPSSILAEMERQEREKTARGGAESDSEIVILDEQGNKISLNAAPVRSTPGKPEDSSGEEAFTEIAANALLRPYTDAEGNVKWIDKRSEETKRQHVQETLKLLGQDDSDSKSSIMSGVSRLRGGGRGGWAVRIAISNQR